MAVKMIDDPDNKYGVKSSIEFSNRYGISDRTLRQWRQNLVDKKPLQDSSGRPLHLDAKGKEEVLQDIHKLSSTRHPPDDVQLAEILRKRMRETAARKNKVNATACKQTIKNYKKMLGLKARKPQIRSKAREVAGSDPRMVYSL